MRFLLLGIVFSWLSVNNIAHASDIKQPWVAEKINWQVMRVKNKADKNVCLVRWKYDHDVSLSFIKKGDGYAFLLKTPKVNPDGILIPQIEKGESYYGVLEKKSESINQITAKATSNNSMILELPSQSKYIQNFNSLEAVSLYFTDSVMDLPLPNAAENFEAFSQCLNTLKDVNNDTAAEKKDLNNRAVENIRGMHDDITIPPPLPAFRRSKTKVSVIESYKKQNHNNDYKEINASLLKKLRILEAEKEGLRKRLLYLTQDAYIADLVACEPSGGQANNTNNAELEASYEAIIQSLKMENQTLKKQSQELSKGNKEANESLNTCQSFIEK